MLVGANGTVPEMAYFVRTSDTTTATTAGGIPVRHQQETPDNGPRDYLAARSELGAPARTSMPARAAGSDAAQAPAVLQAVAALGHTLVAPLPFERALEEALLQGAQLLPVARELLVYAVTSADNTRLTWLAAVVRNAAGVAPAPAESARAIATLGHGEAVDQQVLDERRAVQVAGVQSIPLVGSRGTLLGVLEIDLGAPAAREPEAPAAALVADHVTALLERHAEEQARDAFVSLAAHELRSPLTSIKGYAQLLMRQARKSPLPETMLRSVESIEQQSLRMAEMVGEMLDASRILRHKLDVALASMDLVPLAQRVVERRRVFFPQHELVFETAESSLVGKWDAARVEQIVRDLIDNAGRHMPGSGVVTVSLAPEGDQALVRVRDTGIGVAEEERERIFEYLYRSPRSEERNLSGLGLGLFVSRYLAERMGGRLWLHETSTAEPSGSEFRLTLPLIS
jgi:signal transduction histidine kinase